MIRRGALAAALLLLISALVHLATYVPGVPVRLQYVWPLHVLTLAAFAWGAVAERPDLRRLPGRAQIALFIAFLFMAINFAVAADNDAATGHDLGAAIQVSAITHPNQRPFPALETHATEQTTVANFDATAMVFN